jgi:hypothetical protein
MLQSERIRVIGLILVLSFLLIVIAIRALFGGVPEQLHLLPRFTALILASTAYESLMLRLVSRAIQRRSDLPLWVWLVNTGIEAHVRRLVMVLVHIKTRRKPSVTTLMLYDQRKTATYWAK